MGVGATVFAGWVEERRLFILKAASGVKAAAELAINTTKAKKLTIC